MLQFIARASSIQRKLNLILMLTVGTALALAAATLLAVEVRKEWSNAQRNLVTQADVVALASEAAIAFADPRTGEQNLRVLVAQPSVVAAALYDGRGELFASFRTPAGARQALPARAPALGVQFGLTHASVVRPIISNQEVIGSVFIQTRHGLVEEVGEYVGWLAVAALGSLFAALLLSRWLKRSLTAPIEEVSRVARTVLERSSFDVRATRRSDDEVGQLVDAFNAMLDELGARAAVLQESNRAKDAFLATLAHELRNPLAPLRTGLHVLKKTGAAPAGVAQRTLDTMDRQLTHMVRLIDDLLDISRINSGKIRLEIAPISLKAAVQTALELSRPALDAAGHALHVALPEHEVQIQGDETRLAQAFGNLLNNAAKYTPPGGQVWLRMWQESATAVVQVQDNGVGIPTEMQEKVFSLFAQIDDHARQSAGGLGIGLVLVRNLIEMHGGSVQASSPGAGLGCTFSVRLPVRTAPDPAPVSTPSGEQAMTSSAGTRVLVVDDNVDAAETLTTFLELVGIASRAVNDGESAVQAALDFAPDVVLLDIGLPGMSGYDVARALRSQAALTTVKLVALTGWGAEDDRRRAREAGFDHHLTKPVDLAVLQAMLRQLQDEQRS